MLSQHIALVPEAGGLNASDLARVCAALQKQVTRDLGPCWGIAATVNGFPHLEDVPLGHWPIIVTFCDLGEQAGVQVDRNGQPYAEVEMSPDWSLHASQACLDMLVNPFGSRLVVGPSPRPDQGPVEFLVEACAPCAGPDYAYVIDDVLVSDFCTPAYWGSISGQQRELSFTGAVRAPQQVLPGGHLTWHDPIGDKWWLRDHVADALVDSKLGSIDGRLATLRETMLSRAPRNLRAAKMSIEAFESRLGIRRQHALQASQFQAHRTRTLVANSVSTLARDQGTTSFDDSGGVRRRRNQDSIALLNGAAHFSDESTVNAGSLQRPTDGVEREGNRRDLIETPGASGTRPPPLPDQPQVSSTSPTVSAISAPGATSLYAGSAPQRFPGSFATASTSIASTIPPPTAVSYPPAMVPPAQPRVNGWLFGATLAVGGAALVLAVNLYGNAARTSESTHSPLGAAALSPNAMQLPTAVLTPTPGATAPAPALGTSSNVAAGAVQPEPALSPLPEVTRPIASTAAKSAARPSRPPVRSARPETTQGGSSIARSSPPEEPTSDPVDSLIVERR
jgi:hypothetical protein